MYPLQNIIIPKTKVANIDNKFIAINITDIFLAILEVMYGKSQVETVGQYF